MRLFAEIAYPVRRKLGFLRSDGHHCCLAVRRLVPCSELTNYQRLATLQCHLGGAQCPVSRRAFHHLRGLQCVSRQTILLEVMLTNSRLLKSRRCIR